MSEKLKERLGYAMLAAPFVAVFVLGVVSIGILKIALVFAGVLGLIAWCKVAVDLLP